MENKIKQAIFYLVVIFSLWLMILGLLVGGLVLQFKALFLALAPLIGPASAYAVSGLACLGLVLLIGLLLWLRGRLRASRRKSSLGSEGSADMKYSVGSYEFSRIFLEKHPLEAVIIAFVAGFSSSDSTELKKLLGFIMREI